MKEWIERFAIRIDPGRLRSHLERFADQLAETGYQDLTIGGYLRSVAHFGFWITQCDIALEEIDGNTLNGFENHRCECPHLPRWTGRTQRYMVRIHRFVDFLAHDGFVPRQKVTTVPELPLLVEFRNWLSNHRGLSESTINRNVALTSRLLSDLVDDPGQYTAATIRETVCVQASRHSRAQAKCIVTALRSFLKFLASQGQLRAELVGAVPSLPQWRLSSLPRYLPEEDIERLIDSCSSDDPCGVRDRAVLLLLSRLGLRAGDIVALRVEDVDWKSGRLRVLGKGRRECRLPLPQEVGDALLTSLESARPEVSIDQVFLCSNAPWRPFAGSMVVSSIVAAALRRAGIENSPSRGASLLRHSAATTMLRAGLDLEGVGAILRHRSVDMTAHYAKVDVETLAEVSQPWPEVSHVE
ncbi:MAG: tyrosine-type recombinase/integrase [Pirellulaceae bacterium]|nr:tyrosine-type recombinase/integrase [Pirellulaceae bacterium]